MFSSPSFVFLLISTLISLTLPHLHLLYLHSHSARVVSPWWAAFSSASRPHCPLASPRRVFCHPKSPSLPLFSPSPPRNHTSLPAPSRLTSDAIIHVCTNTQVPGRRVSKEGSWCVNGRIDKGKKVRVGERRKWGRNERMKGKQSGRKGRHGGEQAEEGRRGGEERKMTK